MEPTIGYFWAILLGAVQGLAEFLPISSSGHLALVEHIGLGTAAPPSFDVALHLATLAVVLVYFRRAILWYLKNDPIVLLFVIVSTIPTALIGLACKRYFELLRESPTMICIGLLVTASALSVAELHRGLSFRLRQLGFGGALLIGLCQALALAPGVSRSGATITGAMICGIEREEAFRYSFMLSIPAVAGAVALHGMDLIRHDAWQAMFSTIALGPLLAGCLTAIAAGFIALSVLERVVVSGKLVWFAAYCCLAALVGLVYFNALV